MNNMKIVTLILFLCSTICAFGCWRPDGLKSQLCHAVRTHNIGAAQALLQREEVKRIINEPADEGEPVLHWAAILGDSAMVTLLLDNGANPILCDNDGDTPLHSAAIGGSVAVAQILLKRGAIDTINAIDSHGYVPLHDAAFHGHAELIRFLLNSGAQKNINHVALNGLTPLGAALKNHHMEVARILQECKAK